MSIVPEISTDLVFGLYKSQEEFPVDFDIAWQWLGFTQKNNAKRSLLDCGFEEGVDLLIKEQSTESQFGTPEEQIQLTVDCFKMWSMMVGTERGKEVRLYFLQCEKQLNKLRSKLWTDSDVISELSGNIDICNLSSHTLSKLFDLSHFRRNPELMRWNNLKLCKALDGLNPVLLEMPEDVISYLWAKFCIETDCYQESLESENAFVVNIVKNAIKEHQKIVNKPKYINAAKEFQKKIDLQPFVALSERRSNLLIRSIQTRQQIDFSLLAEANKLLSDCFASLSTQQQFTDK
jgi:phage anti-repressor protein